jgi:hypothetical protein
VRIGTRISSIRLLAALLPGEVVRHHEAHGAFGNIRRRA